MKIQIQKTPTHINFHVLRHLDFATSTNTQLMLQHMWPGPSRGQRYVTGQQFPTSSRFDTSHVSPRYKQVFLKTFSLRGVTTLKRSPEEIVCGFPFIVFFSFLTNNYFWKGILFIKESKSKRKSPFQFKRQVLFQISKNTWPTGRTSVLVCSLSWNKFSNTNFPNFQKGFSVFSEHWDTLLFYAILSYVPSHVPGSGTCGKTLVAKPSYQYFAII